jgi:hypothetical protein
LPVKNSIFLSNQITPTVQHMSMIRALWFVSISFVQEKTI